MTWNLHTNIKIPFKDPYVVRIQYDETVSGIDDQKHFRDLTKKTRKTIHGSWGFSYPELEKIPVPVEELAQTTSSPTVVFYSDSFKYLNRGYFCFNDEIDALQFRLGLGSDIKAVQVVMWPKNRLFTIHEVVETDEQ